MRARGYTLVEAILASFLLVFTFFLVSRLFQTGLQFSAQVDSRITAVSIAEKRMAEIRKWAKDPGRKAWTGYPTGNDPAFPAYKITETVEKLEDEALFSPSRELESAHPADDRRSMTVVARKVTISVAGGRTASFKLAGVVLLGEVPWTSGARIVITGNTSAPIGPYGTDPRVFTARALDGSNDEIKDIFFHWAVEPVFGTNPTSADIRNATRDGRKATFSNFVRARNGANVVQNGECQAMAYARYRGRFIWAKTTKLELSK